MQESIAKERRCWRRDIALIAASTGEMHFHFFSLRYIWHGSRLVLINVKFWWHNTAHACLCASASCLSLLACLLAFWLSEVSKTRRKKCWHSTRLVTSLIFYDYYCRKPIKCLKGQPAQAAFSRRITSVTYYQIIMRAYEDTFLPRALLKRWLGRLTFIEASQL